MLLYLIACDTVIFVKLKRWASNEVEHEWE